MKIKLYRCLMTKLLVSNSLRTLSIGVFVGMTLPGVSGCKGTPLPFSQSFSGLGGATRVPAPADGSFQVPGSYSGPNGTFKFQLCQQCFCSEWNEDVAIQLACHQLR